MIMGGIPYYLRLLNNRQLFSQNIDRLFFSQNGFLTDILKNLTSSGFIRISNYYHQKKKDALYQLSDYYTAFYFRFIKDKTGMDEHYWSSTTDNPARRAWSGLTFERFCKDHITQIKRKLGISGVLSEESVLYVQKNEEEGITGTQIVLIIERRDMVINHVIDKNYDAVLRNKINTFRRLTNTRKSLSMTIITTYGVKQNKYSSMVQIQVNLDDLFHE